VKWKKIDEEIPHDSEQVLIGVARDFHLATFNAARRVFLLQNKKEIEAKGSDLRWLRIKAPK
jgi:hypothetical protein